MNRKLLGGIVALVVVLVGVWLLWFRGHGDKSKPATAEARTGELAKPTAPPPKQPDAPRSPSGPAPRWQLDVDHEGPLRLEGQVLGPDGKGVGGAQVWLSSVPPRSATTEEDGSFAFDKLVGRTYYLSATTTDLIGGPVTYKLTATSDPIVIRLAEGAAVVVTVTDEASAPIAGAEVKQREDKAVKTGADGKATVKPVAAGWLSVEASAPGYAKGSAFTTVGSAGSTGQLAIRLHKGFPVSGRVIDEAGKPVAKAKVSEAGGMWDLGRGSEDAVTDDKGQFQIPALAAGRHTLVAIDGEHAPARSAPVTVADHAVTGVEITMKTGGVVAGTVVDADKRPVPYATVRVAANRVDPMGFGSDTRQATTDAKGAFEVRGLGRIKLQARAESDAAASKVADVDLTDKPKVTDLVLVLDVTGQIAGTVTDEAGQPVPEVQVNAFPDIMGGASTDGLALAGMTSATTDGGGNFVLHGLPDGAYRLWAARSSGNFQEWGQHGTAAKTGDKNVKITLPAPGGLKGKVVLDGATTQPKLITVQVGQQPPTPATDGVFELKELAPGSYDVAFRSPEFAETFRRDIKVEPGKTTDMGTVTVVRGRRLTGKVVDASGTPVAGAKVKLGEMLFSSEGNDEDQVGNIEDMMGIRSAISDADGEFAIVGVPSKPTTAMADHPDKGRSIGVNVPEGTDDPPPLTLTLRGFGSIAGKVTMKGKPVANVTISESTKGGGAQASFARTAEDGTFTMTKVPEGSHVLQAMQQQMMAMKATSVTVQVTAGHQATVTIDIPVGTITLAVTVKPLPNNKVDAAQVFLLRGTVAPANGKQLTDGFFQGGAQGMKFWFGAGKPDPEFDELVAGDYSVCTIPITGDLSEPTFMQRLQENVATLRVYCKAVKVAPAPTRQTVTSDVPAMTPLPAPH